MVNITSTEDLKKLPEADILVNYIAHRKKQGLYTLVFAAGLPGSGKTSTCCRLGELIWEKLSEGIPKIKIIDNFLDFCVFVEEAQPEGLNICVLEEASVLFPSRRAMSGDNVDMGKLLDIVRKKEVILLANAPLWTTIDSHMRALGNVYIETLKIYKIAGIVVSKFQRLQTNPRSGKTYHKNFHRDNKEAPRMYTRQSNKEQWADYEKSKDAFIHNITQRAKARAFDKQRKDDKLIRQLDPTNIEGFTSQELRIFDAVKLKGMKQSDVAETEGLTQGRISQIIIKINKMKENY